MRRWLFKNQANLISVSRGPLAIWIFLFGIYGKDEPAFLSLLFLLGAASDALDGWVARKNSIESNLGKALDAGLDKPFNAATAFSVCILYWPQSDLLPLASTLTAIAIAFFAVVEASLILLWVGGIIFGLSLASNKWGKRKMRAFCAAMSAWLATILCDRFFGTDLFPLTIYVIDLFIGIAGVCGFLSVSEYWQRFLEYKKTLISA